MAASMSIIARLWWRRWRSSIDRRRQRAPCEGEKNNDSEHFSELRGRERERLLAEERKSGRETERKYERMICDDRFRDFRSRTWLPNRTIIAPANEMNERSSFESSMYIRSLKQLIHYNLVNSEFLSIKRRVAKWETIKTLCICNIIF